MAGLLDFATDPQSAMITNMALGLLSAGGPQSHPVSLGQAMGQAGQMGMQGYKDAYGLQMQKLQMQQLLRRNQIINQAMQEGMPTQSSQDTTSPMNSGLMSESGIQQPSAANPQNSPATGGAWSPSKINMFAMSGDPGLMKAAELEQSRQLSQQTDLTKLLNNANISDPALRQQILQAAIAKANNLPPTRLGEGAYFNPATQSVQGLPSQAPAGYINQQDGNGNWSTVPVKQGLAAATSSAGAIESAKEGNKIGMAVVNGKSVPVRMGDVISSPNANANATAGFPSVSPVEQQSRDQERYAILQNELKTNPNDPFLNSEIKRMQTNGFGGSSASTNTPWDTMPKMVNPSGIGMTPYQEGVQKNASGAAEKLSEKYGTLAESNNQRIALNNQSLDLVNKSDIGPGAVWTADLKNIVQKYVPGISESDFQNTPSATLALQKDLVNAATAKAKQQFGSRITQSEVMLMMTRGSPNVNMTKAAIQYLLQSDNANAQYGIQQSTDLGKYLGNGGDPYQFEGWYSKNFPMTNATSGVHMQPNATTPGGGSSNPVASFADIAATAKASGRSTAEVTAALKAKGYMIKGIQ